ncbi:hypothetical protein BDZ45DRAFT_751117 [Acephala macrosclerotiorum]|nr:hypothetical protein BDZ45DRAFT_751117 [Acephala macrosclerotiorum]
MSSATPGISTINWAPSSAGWAYRPANRADQHRGHKSSDNALKNLFETCLDFKFPGKDFRMRMIRIAQILDVRHAAWAEYVVSIMEGSYCCWGGLNGALAGGGSVRHNAETKITDQGWIRSAKTLFK